jgi:hypothetical protein
MSWASLLAGIVALFNQIASYLSRQTDVKAGRDAEKVKAAERAIEAAKGMHNADARGPRTGSDAADRMRDGTF